MAAIRLVQMECGHTSRAVHPQDKRRRCPICHTLQDVVAIDIAGVWVPFAKWRAARPMPEERAHTPKLKGADRNPWGHVRVRADGLLVQYPKDCTDDQRRWWCVRCDSKRRRCADLSQVFLEWDQHKASDRHGQWATLWSRIT